MVGALIAGPLADKYGRRLVSISSMFIISAGGLASAAASDVLIFILLRSFVGVGIGCFVIPFDLCAEMTPRPWRGFVLTAVNFWWGLGSLFCVWAAWVVLGSGGSWRMLCVICAIPCFLNFLCMTFLPESPRWLLARGRVEEAEKTIKLMARWNGVEMPPLSLKPVSLADETASVSEVLATPARRKKFGLLGVAWCGMGFCFYGTSFMLTRVYATTDDDETCSFDYGFLFAIYTSEFWGILYLLYQIDAMGRPLSNITNYCASAVFVLLLGTSSSNISSLAFGYGALLTVNAAATATWVMTPELFDTKVRSTVHAMLTAASRVAAFFSSYWVDSSVGIFEVGLLLAVVNVVAGVAAFNLPDTRDAKLR